MGVNKHYYYSIFSFRRRAINGFTVVELIFTLAIAAILITIGVPSYSGIIKKNRQITLLNEFTSYFHFTKSQAVTLGTPVTLCQRNTAGTNCDASASWDNGWIVFVDNDADGNLDDDGDTDLCEAGEDDDCLLKIHDAIDSDMDITSTSTSVTINARGFTSASTFIFCDSRGDTEAKAKTVSKTGRMQTSTQSVTC